MPLVFMKDGRYVLHRIIRVDRKDGEVFYQTRGDNCINSEYVSQDAVCGVVKEIYYKNRTVKVTDTAYRIYVKIWMNSYWLRKFLMKARGFISRKIQYLKTFMK